jgi:hypothetical protein
MGGKGFGYYGVAAAAARAALVQAALLVATVSGAAQAVPVPSPSPAAEPSLKTPQKPAVRKAFADRRGISRWFELDALSIATRYQFIKNGNGATAANSDQFQFVAKGRFKFDAKGKYSVNVGLQTGSVFNGGWNPTGWGTGRGVSNIFVKQLYFEARPVKGLSIQVGGIGINNGVNTEVTGYDNDGYIMGERVSLKFPKHLYFDEIHLTNANIGDLNRPNVFRRFKRLDESNYHQFLVIKSLNKRVSFSGDYTFEAGMDTLRQAVRVKVPETKLFDTLLFENYQRLDPQPGYGFNLQGDKKVTKDLTLLGGFARIDRSILNGDRFPRGNRLHLTGTYTLSKEFTITAWVIQGIGPIAPNIARTRVNVLFTYNILQTLRRAHIF